MQSAFVSAVAFGYPSSELFLFRPEIITNRVDIVVDAFSDDMVLDH